MARQAELEPYNLITLCEAPGSNHHFWFGHLGDWKSANKRVLTDAKNWSRRIRNRPYPHLGYFQDYHGEHCMSLEPYPTNLSIEAITDCAGYFRGTVPVNVAVHGAYELLGYALGNFLPDALAPSMTTVPGLGTALPSGEVAAVLIESAARPTATAAVGFPWLTLIALAMQILSQFLGK